MGMIEAGSDKGGTIATTVEAITYFATISQIPVLDLFLEKNPYFKIGPTGFGWAVMPAVTAVQERMGAPTEEKFSRQSDFLDKFLEVQKEK